MGANRAIKILIVEDDIIIATHISKVLEKAGYEVDGILPKGEAAIAHIQANPPDIILLDIALKGDIDGVETAQKIRQYFSIPILFLTANADEATFARAKATQPEDFISKPFKPRQLLRSLELVISRMEAKSEALAAATAPESEPVILEDRIFLRHKERMVKVFLKDVLFIEAERNYCRVHTLDKQHILSIPLKTFEQRLNSDLFIRVHRSYLVNLSAIDELDEHYLFIQNHSIPLGKSYKEALGSRLKLM